MTSEQRDGPTTQQQKYLGLLLTKSHEKGVPHLPINALSRRQASQWIDYLRHEEVMWRRASARRS